MYYSEDCIVSHVKVYEAQVSYPGRNGRRRFIHVTILADSRDSLREVHKRIRRRVFVLYNEVTARRCKIESVRDCTSV